ncbi:MAG: UbiD family decarboxylase, partial [Dehalococcoidia bacterium]|nr:UbiD family decarboxylase [Dehalococcoidia bacterium]
ITKDPETGWVNLGTYRGMVHDGQSMGFFLEQDRHASIHRQKYWEAGKPCPVAISFGHDPLLFLVACQTIPYGFSEYDYAGGIRGEPIEVIEGQVTGLPIPACSEIVIEGESLPDDARAEGPFAEWTGYYGRQAEPTPIIRVKAVYHRRDPILCGRPTNSSFMSLMKSARVWDQLEAAGVPGVQGVWCEPKTRGYLWMVVSIKQRYPGHAKQAALVASQCGAAKDMGRFVIVVDDDVDPSNLTEVLWAMCTRADPERSIDIVRRCCGGYLDTANRQGERGFTSHAIIDACRPYEWLGDFPPMVEVSPALKERVMQKWGELVFP